MKMVEPSEVQIRRATPADLPRLAHLIYDSFVEYRSLYTDEGFAATTPTSEQLRQRMHEGPIWVATNEHDLLGTVSVVAREDHLYIRGMAVSPQARGFGWGALLLRTIEDFARAEGHAHLKLSTTPFLTQASRLYERFGFQRTAEGPHDLYGTPLFTMLKDLLLL